MTSRPTSSVLRILLVVAALAAACSSDEGGLDLESSNRQDDPSDEREATDGAAEPVAGEAVDITLTRDDIDCSRFGLGEDDTVTFVAAHVVVDGVLGEPCLGEVDSSLVNSWNILASMTPPAQLTDLGLFGGFEMVDESEDETLLAFVNTLDDDGSQFQMSVNLPAADDDPDELTLTMAHEFSHVFTGVSSQLDRSPEAVDDCTTYFNGEGCYREGSVMLAWIEEFWAGDIDDIDPNDEPTVEGGELRCGRDPSFFGSYAASNPEEDFAESFSAYVLRLDATEEQQPRLDFIDDQSGLVGFRLRAVAAGLGPLDNSFPTCGLSG